LTYSVKLLFFNHILSSQDNEMVCWSIFFQLTPTSDVLSIYSATLYIKSLAIVIS